MSQSKRGPQKTNSLQVRVKFSNNLPDLPFDPKFLVNPLDINRYVSYETTSLEREAKHELLTPMDLGVDIDLVLPERYAVPTKIEYDPDDEKLLNDDEPAPQLTKKSPRDKPHSQLHNKVVPWLKKTEYISTEYNRYGSGNEKTETKVGYNVRKNLKEDEVFLDRDSQIKAINQTFEAAKKPIEKHPTKPGVYATRVLDLLPDYDLWRYCFARVKFDDEPAKPEDASKMSHAIMRGAHDNDTDENFVVYFLPDIVTLTDRDLDESQNLLFTENKEYNYESTREYYWSAKQNPESEDFFFVFRDDAVYYNRLPMDVTLKKRRVKGPNQAKSKLIVKYRHPNEEDMTGADDKLKQLQRPTPSVPEDIDLTAQSLEQSYEEMSQEGRAGDGMGAEDSKAIASPDVESSAKEDSSAPSSSASSSAASSEPESSSSASSSEEESDDEKDDDKNDTDDDDD